MLSLIEEEIIKNKKEKTMDYTCGIYFLINNNKIVYVGQSVVCEWRIHLHFIEGYRPGMVLRYKGVCYKEFDSYFILPVIEKKKLNDTERYYIKKFKPIYNKVLYKYHIHGEGEKLDFPLGGHNKCYSPLDKCPKA